MEREVQKTKNGVLGWSILPIGTNVVACRRRKGWERVSGLGREKATVGGSIVARWPKTFDRWRKDFTFYDVKCISHALKHVFHVMKHIYHALKCKTSRLREQNNGALRKNGRP